MKTFSLLIFAVLLLSCNEGLNSSKPNLDDMRESDVHLVRTDFSSDTEWNQLLNLILTPESRYGAVAYVYVVDDSAFEDSNREEIAKNLNKDYNYSIFFIADEITFQSSDFPILCVEIEDSTTLTGRSFRIKATDLFIAQNNLSISNMDFEDFSERVDSDGVFIPF